MMHRSLFCRPGTASGKASHILHSLLLLVFLSLLFVTVPSFSFASDRSDKAVAEQEVKQPAYSMSRFFNDARQFFGVRYRWGGETPEGFDCSGFVKFMYKRMFGTALPRTSIEMASIGKKVERCELQPGDLVFFKTRGRRINHVGIFVGNDTFIHSSLSRGVTEDQLENRYFDKRFAGAVRVIDGIVFDMPYLFPTPSEKDGDPVQPS